MSIIQGNAKQASTRGFYNFPLEQSLRFNDDDSAYLSYRMSAGDQKTMTISMWVKRSTLSNGTSQRLFFRNNSDASNQFGLFFQADDTLRLFSRVSGTDRGDLRTTAVFRDTSAWYHIVASMDAANTTATLWVNGVDLGDNSVTTFQNVDHQVNADNVIFEIGRRPNAEDHFFDGYLAEVNFIDGTALTADDFGELKNGVWIPKDPSGLTYGTNGFRLSFADDAEVEAFNTVLYRGNGGTQSVTGYGFEPDLVWIKERNSTGWHRINDTLRGTGKQLYTNDTSAEDTAANNMLSFDSDGFTVGSDGSINGSGDTYVAWGWKAGDSNVSNTDGSITSTVRANTTYGFSIVSYSGTGSSGTIGHGLGTAPSLIIVKARNIVESWFTWHTGITSNGGFLKLDQTQAASTNASAFPWNPQSDTFGVSGDTATNNASGTYIAYCWAEKAGYSKFGSYEGTGTTQTVTGLGFAPSLVIVKNIDNAGAWAMFDNTRPNGPGPANNGGTSTVEFLQANVNNAEGTSATVSMFFDSDGFTVGTSNADSNASGDTYIYAAFADTREAAFWLDQSGNDNDWQPVNLDHNDTVADSPTDNFATWNPLDKASGATLSDGNLLWTDTDSWASIRATFGLSSGKWYWECTGTSGSNFRLFVGIADSTVPLIANNNLGDYDGAFTYYSATGAKYSAGIGGGSGGTSYGDTFTAGDVIGVALDMDAGTLTFYKNNSSQGTAFTGLSGTYFPAITSETSGCRVNFGQSGFTYTPPTDYLALSTANLPDPVIDPAQGSSPEDYFGTVVWAGNGSATKRTDIQFDGVQPDLVWLKNRTLSRDYALHDDVRGLNARIKSNNTEAESTSDAPFDTDGFGFNGVDTQLRIATTNSSYNASGSSYVAWGWKASGASGVSNTDGSITSQVSANTESGFSIVSYTGNGTAGATIGHGLNQAPDVMIVKNRDNGGMPWLVYHSANTSAPETDYLLLNSTAATTDFNTAWNDTSPTSSVFSVGTADGTNQNANDIIAYCFHSVEGFSKFGSYTGNGSADGSFIYCGFRPAFLLVKVTNTASSWLMFDTARDTSNVVNDTELAPNSSGAEGADAGDVSHDILSNGFKWRATGGDVNGSGNTYIYMAFAENPFKYSNAR